LIFGGKKFLNKICVFFSTNFIWNMFHSKKNLAIYCHKCGNVFM
jgi:hypothetical protein